MSGGQRVLAISSHVVHGYVGQKAATFPMQLAGFDVDVINTVHLSNHPAYPQGFKGRKMEADHLREVMEGLEANGILTMYSHVLCGYMGSAACLEAAIEAVKKVKAVNPSAQIVIDPVLGDNGSLYLPPELVPIYRTQLIPLADLLLPNQTELEFLVDRKCATAAEVWKAVDELLGMGPSRVVVTSTTAEFEGADSAETLTMAGACGAGGGFTVAVPRVPKYFTGTGDLLSALILVATARTPADADFPAACARAVEAVQDVIAATVETNSFEIRIVQSRASYDKLFEGKPPSLAIGSR